MFCNFLSDKGEIKKENAKISVTCMRSEISHINSAAVENAVRKRMRNSPASASGFYSRSGAGCEGHARSAGSLRLW